MEPQHYKTLKAFWTDNGGEYVTKHLKRIFESKGMIYEFTPSYYPESNGVAKHHNWTIREALCVMRISACSYYKKLCAEAVLTSKYIKYCQPHLALKKLICWTGFHCSKPLMQHLQHFCKQFYVNVPYQKWPDGKKSTPTTQTAIFTGCTNTLNNYSVFWHHTKKTIVSRGIFFPVVRLEGDSPLICGQVNLFHTPLITQEMSVVNMYANTR